MSFTQRQSQDHFDRAQRSIPGGVNSPARAFGAVGGVPVVMDRGQGAYLFDIDGNRYLDFIGSWGPMILGHSHPKVVEAAIAAIRNGSSYGAPCELETELAEIMPITAAIRHAPRAAARTAAGVSKPANPAAKRRCRTRTAASGPSNMS